MHGSRIARVTGSSLVWNRSTGLRRVTLDRASGRGE
jgi:hypothetical protein